MKSFGSLIAIIIVLAIAYKGLSWGYDLLRSKSWTLFLCQSVMSDDGCFENKYELEGYENQNECMEKGIVLSKGNAFECGYDCRVEYGTNVCKRVCGKNGCRE